MGKAGGTTGKGRGTPYTQPFHHSAGRRMVFGDGCRDAPARCRETSERSGLRRRSPPPPRLDFRIKWGPAAAAALLRGPARAASTARRAHSAPCLAARSQGFPPGPCAAASCRSSCWRWSSARRPGDRPLRCRRRETPSWPRCTRAATTGRWVSVRRAPVLGGTRPPQGAGSPALSVSGGPASGAGFAPAFLPRRHPRSPRTPLHPSPC